MTDTTTYKEQLEAEKTSLTEKLQEIARPNPLNTNEWEAIQTEAETEPDPNDQAQHLDEYQENRAVVNVLNQRYQAIIQALERIEKGTYGKCVVCNEDIDEARLNADPAAATCTVHISQ